MSSRIIKYIFFGILLVTALVAGRFFMRNFVGFDEIQWRGEKFKLKQKYFDYEDYKGATNQFTDDEAERVKKVILSISVPKKVGSEQELRSALRQMRFPGYGSTYDGSVKDESGNRYILNEYEIPQKNQQRTLLYRVEPDGSCQLVVDGISVDHVNDHILGNSHAKVEGKNLRHFLDGKMYREIPLDPQ